MDSPYNSNTGRSNGGAGAAYNSHRSGGSPVVGGGRRSSGGSHTAATSDIRQSLHGTGFKVRAERKGLQLCQPSCCCSERA